MASFKKVDKDLLNSFLRSSTLAESVYVIGMMQTGVTVYNQQVRALNLLYTLDTLDCIKSQKINAAVIGGGIAGLTAAAGFLKMFPESTVSIFEQHADLCPLQQGTDSRWLHPNIYEWPNFGSRQPTAGLPFLSWREGRASDVASQVLLQFAKLCKDVDPYSERIKVYLDVKELKLSSRREISWVGYETFASDGFFRKSESLGDSKEFDIVLIAAGFGREKSPTIYNDTRLYWQNDDLSQPRLTNEARTFVISGAGDGSLVDLFRLTIERFRQDRIVYEMFGKNPEAFESELRNALLAKPKGKTYWAIFEDLRQEGKLDSAIKILRTRIRKDTRTVLHLAGPTGNIKTIESALELKSSLLNKLILFLLHRCGAFIPSFDPLEEVIASYKPGRQDIICRHGTSPVEALQRICLEPISKNSIERLRSIQYALPLWHAGYFPMFPGVKL